MAIERQRPLDSKMLQNVSRECIARSPCKSPAIGGAELTKYTIREGLTSLDR
jgi:hypothetical protein